MKRSSDVSDNSGKHLRRLKVGNTALLHQGASGRPFAGSGRGIWKGKRVKRPTEGFTELYQKLLKTTLFDCVNFPLENL